MIPGLYFSEAANLGFDESNQEASMAYIAHVQTRALIVIKNEEIGLVVCMPVGMIEVSSNILHVQEGDQVRKGEELGYFQYGGSTIVTLFQQGVIKEFSAGYGKPLQKNQFLLVNQQIARVPSKKEANFLQQATYG